MTGVNAVAWLGIHLGLAWAVTRMPLGWFDPRGFPFRRHRWERGGVWYDRVLHIKRWKGLLPDGALLFARGFAKGRILGRDPAYLERYIRETCRGETVHWLVALLSPLFFLWNPRRAGIINVVYGCLANLPCVFAMRYNRLHLQRILTRYPKNPTTEE
jgi:glycosyl-4,4'-diaponeurosporenoate acyltransferase